MKYSEKTLDLQKKYLNSLEKDVLLWLRNFFDALKKESEPPFSKIIVYVMFDPQSEGMSTYIDGIVMFDEHDKNVRVPEDIRKKIYNRGFLYDLEEIHFTGKIEYANGKLKMFEGVFDEEFEE